MRKLLQLLSLAAITVTTLHTANAASSTGATATNGAASPSSTATNGAASPSSANSAQQKCTNPAPALSSVKNECASFSYPSGLSGGTDEYAIVDYNDKNGNPQQMIFQYGAPNGSFAKSDFDIEGNGGTVTRVSATGTNSTASCTSTAYISPSMSTPTTGFSCTDANNTSAASTTSANCTDDASYRVARMAWSICNFSAKFEINPQLRASKMCSAICNLPAADQ